MKNNMQDGTQRKLGAVLSYVSIIANTIVGLVYTPFLIKQLGQSEYGLYSLVSSVIGYLTILDFGFGNAVIVYTAKYRAQKEYKQEKKLQGMFFLIFCIIAIIIAILGVVLYFLTPTIFGKTMTIEELEKAKILVIILIINLILNFIFTIYQSIINAYEEFVFQKTMNIVSIILRPLIMTPLLLLGIKSIGMTLIISCVNVFIMISNYFYCKKKLKIKIKFMGFDKNLFKTIFTYSFYIFLNTIVDRINWSVDKMILGAVSGTIAVSVYSVAAKINDMFINLSTAISGVLLPKVSKMIANRVSDDEITNEFIKIGRLQYYIVFLVVTGFILFGKEFINAWVGQEYVDVYAITLILMIPSSFSLIQNIGISILQAKNKHKFRSILYFFIALANIIISIPLANKYGGIGSAIGTAISLVVGNIIIINIYYYKVIHINVLKFWKNIFRLTISYIVPISIVIVMMNYIHLYGYIHVAVYGIIYTILFALVSYFINMNNYEKDIVNKVLMKLKIKKVGENING